MPTAIPATAAATMIPEEMPVVASNHDYAPIRSQNLSTRLASAVLLLLFQAILDSLS